MTGDTSTWNNHRMQLSRRVMFSTCVLDLLLPTLTAGSESTAVKTGRPHQYRFDDFHATFLLQLIQHTAIQKAHGYSTCSGQVNSRISRISLSYPSFLPKILAFI